jgi:hypothetical protein
MHTIWREVYESMRSALEGRAFWIHLGVGLCSLALSSLTYIVWSTSVIDDGWRELTRGVALWIALAAALVAAWFGFRAASRGNHVCAAAAGVPAIIGVLKPVVLVLSTLKDAMMALLLAD